MLTTTIKWRKWPEDYPKARGMYQVLHADGSVQVSWWHDDQSWVRSKITHWAAIGDITTRDSNPPGTFDGEHGSQ